MKPKIVRSLKDLDPNDSEQLAIRQRIMELGILETSNLTCIFRLSSILESEDFFAIHQRITAINHYLYALHVMALDNEEEQFKQVKDTLSIIIKDTLSNLDGLLKECLETDKHDHERNSKVH
jgi:predicted ferric reductase